ncbi:MAG: hypothetical protein LLG02_10665 [Pelosinus sp.]|nr:hypothetical protein [Pelosinus sp.]
MGTDVSLSLFSTSTEKSSSDALRQQREKLLEKLQRPNQDNGHKDTKEVIVELTSLDKNILQTSYHEETIRLENKRLKNEEYVAMSIRARNKARREREKLLSGESMRKLNEANNRLDECQMQGSASGEMNQAADSIASDVKEAQDLSAEAAQVAQRRHNDEWKEYAEEKARKRKSKLTINIGV